MPQLLTSSILSTKLYLYSSNLEVVNDIYDQFGPTPQLCLENAQDPNMLGTHKCQTTVALEVLMLTRIEDLTHNL